MLFGTTVDMKQLIGTTPGKTRWTSFDVMHNAVGSLSSDVIADVANDSCLTQS